jgi:Zn-dependent M32 family carboxypeptidase
VYHQNCILGERTAWQLPAYITPRALSDERAPSVQVGTYLKERFFHLGARFDWNGALKAATGEELKPEYFARHLA